MYTCSSILAYKLSKKEVDAPLVVSLENYLRELQLCSAANTLMASKIANTLLFSVGFFISRSNCALSIYFLLSCVCDKEKPVCETCKMQKSLLVFSVCNFKTMFSSATTK